jgi:protein-tyrosine-phosphatase
MRLPGGSIRHGRNLPNRRRHGWQPSGPTPEPPPSVGVACGTSLRSRPHTVPVPEQRREPEFTVLLVCTGNICRSALAERLGRAYLDQALGDDAGAIRLVSAGTQAVVGSAMHPHSALVLRGYGAEPGDFRARQLTDALAADADLMLTMTRAHRRDVLALAPRALARTFTLREAADLLALLGADVQPAGEHVGERARNLVNAMAGARSRRQSGEGDDVTDPIGRPVEVHQEVGEAIAEALLPILRHLAYLAAPEGAGTEDPKGAVVPYRGSRPVRHG